jgi:HK97 family phage prohead protease
METLRDLVVVRSAALPTLFRDLEDMNEAAQNSSLMVVRFSPFDTWYEIDSMFEGRFCERTVRGAFAKTMRESGRNAKVFFNHGHDMSIDEKPLGKIVDLREDTDSAVGEVRLFTEASYVRDLMPAIREGVLGSSFMFRVEKDDWDDNPERSAHNPDGLPERTIKEVRLLEFGPVTWPANPAATVGMRSVTDEYYEHIRSRDPERYNDLRARAVALRTPKPQEADLRATSDANGAAPESDDEPAPQPLGLSPSQRAARLRELRFPFLKETA